MARGLKQKLGEELVARREEKGWSREKLAEVSRVAVNTIGLVERGQGNPALDTLVRLANAHRLSLGDLFTACERRP